jgi:hypothetical protein
MSRRDYSRFITVCPGLTGDFLSASAGLLFSFFIAVGDGAFYGNTPLVKMKLLHSDPQMKGE